MPAHADATGALDSPCRAGQVFLSACGEPVPRTPGVPCNFSDVFASDMRCKTLDDLVGMRSGQLLVDVGLNMPRHWTFMPSAHRRSARVIGFEPIPHICKASKQRANTLGRRRFHVEVHCKAVSDFRGFSTLQVAVETPRSSMSAEVVAGLGLNTSALAVPVTTLDSELLPSHAGRVDILKSDTQGHELAVIRGARKLLQGGGVTFVLAEFDPWLLRNSGASAAELLSELHALGFSCLVVPEVVAARTATGLKRWSDLICAPHGLVTASLGPCAACQDVLE
eukprot:CAMPEP_0204568152 /NCGR_PEP_ID=MMETSP0661-20131031/37014_1 /ASSEMBLY_ACC=CAM_ASM_000606 /TAXON_ID=109239 /ORGANISM="Alexandrium margalefi, Strain AMGDE01CS-322" /LENGTH=280 /DNA_ID=CAMNT_0051576141 /DNA_START=261 /DNA_END=1100 /DNA_ORIENTATION=+